MKNDIDHDPNQSQGWRIGLSLCLGGILILGLGFAMPGLMSVLADRGSDPELAATETVAWLTQLAGLMFLMMGALAVMLWGPFLAVQQKYGTLGACFMFTPGLLLGAAIIATAFR